MENGIELELPPFPCSLWKISARLPLPGKDWAKSSHCMTLWGPAGWPSLCSCWPMGTLGPPKPHPHASPLPRHLLSATWPLAPRPGPWHVPLERWPILHLPDSHRFLTHVLGEMSAGSWIIYSWTQGGGAGHVLAAIKQGYCKHLLSSYCLPCIVLSTWHALFYWVITTMLGLLPWWC